VSGVKWTRKSTQGLLRTLDVGVHRVRVYADRLAIWRHDGDRLTWEELQDAKCKVWGDKLAVEIYPAQADVVNLRHTRHLWHTETLERAVRNQCRHAEFDNAEQNKEEVTWQRKDGNQECRLRHS